MAIFALAGTEGLRDESVEAHEEAAAEKREHDEDIGTEADRAHGRGAVGQAADHHGVDDGHAHPAEFGEDEREREAQSGGELLAKCF